ncbi:glycerophosphoryl diester phosphodiesterase membrane domain-containing protein [Actinomadura fibrosa]|uniref:Glycerophosphoryl diester phosphodiesterase membrane domain-containing protein n=1 Tax=Actinomadura fibrosa TaxID=111802 RepID=A0ABW2XFS3_9ACTN|nr:glycerophosphoryl diester phosphodiesterase membrane domain-containing protein [Actinomadura fibrosa]
MPGPDGWDDVDGAVPFRPMSISELLDGAIAGLRRRPRTILGLSAAISTVIQVASSVVAYYLVGTNAREEVTPGVLLRSFGAQVTLGAVGLVLSAYGILLLAGLLGPVLGREMMGLPIPPGQVWRDVRPRLGRLAATAGAVMAVSLLALVVPVVPFFALVAVNAHPALGVVAALLGFPLGIGLMVWLYILLVQAVPAVVLERETVSGALRRAWTLSKGRWWRTCGTLLLALLVTVFMGFFALRIPFLLVQLAVFGTEPDGGAEVAALAWDTLGRIVSWSVVLPFDAGVITLLYMDRRMRREGLDLDLRLRGRSAAVEDFAGVWRPAPSTRSQTPPPAGPHAPPSTGSYAQPPPGYAPPPPGYASPPPGYASPPPGYASPPPGPYATPPAGSQGPPPAAAWPEGGARP